MAFQAGFNRVGRSQPWGLPGFTPRIDPVTNPQTSLISKIQFPDKQFPRFIANPRANRVLRVP